MTSATSTGEPLDPRLAAIRNFEGKYPKQLWWLFLSEMWERSASASTACAVR